jgi:hypothetical protein
MKIAPVLDTAMAGLREKEHNAIVLRFFENKSFSEIGQALGTSEDAAKMRVNRALEKLRKFFARRGFILSAAALAGAVSANAIQAAPMELASSVTVAAVQGTTLSTSTVAALKGTLKLLAWIRAKTAIGVAVGVLAAAGVTTLGVSTLVRAQSAPLPASGAIGGARAAVSAGGSVGMAVGGGAAAADPATAVYFTDRMSALRQVDDALGDCTVFTSASARNAALPRVLAAIGRFQQLSRDHAQATTGLARTAFVTSDASTETQLTIMKLALDDPATRRDNDKAIAAPGTEAALASVIRAASDYFQAGQEPGAQARAVEEYAQAAPNLAPDAPVIGLPFFLSHNPPANAEIGARLADALANDPRYLPNRQFIVRQFTDPTVIAQNLNQARYFFGGGGVRGTVAIRGGAVAIGGQ